MHTRRHHVCSHSHATTQTTATRFALGCETARALATTTTTTTQRRRRHGGDNDNNDDGRTFWCRSVGQSQVTKMIYTDAKRRQQKRRVVGQSAMGWRPPTTNEPRRPSCVCVCVRFQMRRQSDVLLYNAFRTLTCVTTSTCVCVCICESKSERISCPYTDSVYGHGATAETTVLSWRDVWRRAQKLETRCSQVCDDIFRAREKNNANT